MEWVVVKAGVMGDRGLALLKALDHDLRKRCCGTLQLSSSPALRLSRARRYRGRQMYKMRREELGEQAGEAMAGQGLPRAPGRGRQSPPRRPPATTTTTTAGSQTLRKDPDPAPLSEPFSPLFPELDSQGLFGRCMPQGAGAGPGRDAGWGPASCG